MVDATSNVTRWRIAVAGASLVAASVALAWAVGWPQNPLSDSLIRAVADVSAVVALGLALVPLCDEPRYRYGLAGRAARPLMVAGAVWTIAELVRLVHSAAQAAGLSVGGLDVRTAVEFATATAAGRSGLTCLVAAAVVTVAAALPRSPTSGVAVAAAAALGLAGRSLLGHLSTSTFGGLAVAVHTLAAGLWCGTLVALALTVDRKGQWARVLPRFSQLALGCVAVLVVCGIAGAVVTLPNPAALYTTGYGRLLTAKVVVTAVLAVLAWRNRARWLPAARTHRASAEVSRRRSRVELAIMCVALGFAAALAVTG